MIRVSLTSKINYYAYNSTLLQVIYFHSSHQSYRSYDNIDL